MPNALASAMFDILGTLKKAGFALDLLFVQQEPWPLKAPTYIRNGLMWLQKQLQQNAQEAVAKEKMTAVGGLAKA
jgi:hypothetical protein